MNDRTIEPRDIMEIEYADSNLHSIVIGKVYLQFSWGGLLALRDRINSYLEEKIPEDSK